MLVRLKSQSRLTFAKKLETSVHVSTSSVASLLDGSFQKLIDLFVVDVRLFLEMQHVTGSDEVVAEDLPGVQPLLFDDPVDVR